VTVGKVVARRVTNRNWMRLRRRGWLSLFRGRRNADRISILAGGQWDDVDDPEPPLGRGVTGFDGSDGWPRPAALTPRTTNVYVTPSTRLCVLADVSAARTMATGSGLTGATPLTLAM